MNDMNVYNIRMYVPILKKPLRFVLNINNNPKYIKGIATIRQPIFEIIKSKNLTGESSLAYEL